MRHSPAHQNRLVLVVLFFGVLMAALDIAIVGPALPAIREHFGVDERAIAWVFNTFVLFNLLGLPFMARMSDVAGRRTIYLVDVALFAAGSLTVAVAPSFGVLLAGRALQGLGASGIFPVASAVVGDTFPPEKRGRALGVLGAVFGLAFIVGPIVAGILLLQGWRLLFLVNLPLAAVVAGLSLRHVPRTRPDTVRALDARGAVTLGILLAALAAGINQIDTQAVLASLAAFRVWGLLVLAALLLPVFIHTERRAPDPLIRLQLFSSRQVVLSMLLAAGAGLTEAAFIFFPALAVDAFGVSKSTASFMLLPLVFAVAIGSPVLGRLVDRAGSRAVVLFSTLMLAAGMGTMGLAGDARGGFYTASILIGIGLSGLLGSSLSYILLAESKAAERTVAQGISTLAISVGQLMGGALIGAVAASSATGTDGYLQAFATIAIVAGVLFLVSFTLKGRAEERRALEGADA